MLKNLLKYISKIYVAYGYTDFRKQIVGLCKIVKEHNMNPYEKSAFIFCNKKKTSIKVLIYDTNGFILAQKTLLDVDKNRFKWPRTPGDIRQITKQQLEWLLSGLDMYPKKYFKDIDISEEMIVN